MTSKQRSRARVVQALYQWLVSGGDIIQIEQQFLNQKEGKISKAFFSNLFINIPKNISVLDEIINPTLERD
ncbi:MAG: N utilization substance protein B, partial [Gammaproteobacteria bacterium]|nr:N utilization substance protein B [Gammaproteobacteria bacterium]